MSVSGDPDLDAYERDGVVLLRGAFEQRWVDLVAAAIDRSLASPSPWFKDRTLEGSTGRFLSDMFCWSKIPEFRQFAFESPAAAIAARFMRARKVNFIEDQWFIKEPGARTPTPWHQDQPYYDILGTMCSIWMPVEPVGRGQTLELVRGSSAWGRLFIPNHFLHQTPQGEAVVQEGRRYERMPDIEASRADYDIVGWAMEPGDCIVFNALTIHGAPGNASTRTSRRFATRWGGDDAHYFRKGYPWSTLVEGHGLRQGDPLDSAMFPVVLNRAA